MVANPLGDFFRFQSNLTRPTPSLGGASPLNSLGGGMVKYNGDNTGATDVVSDLETFIEANAGKFVYLGEGVYKFSRALDPDASVLLRGAGKQATVIKYPSTSPAIYTVNQFNYQNAGRVQAAVTGFGIGLAPDGVATTDTDLVTYATVADASIYTNGQPAALTSADAHPAEALLSNTSKRRLGFAGFTILYCDTTVTPHRVYFNKIVPYVSLLTTSVYLSQFKTDRFFSVRDIGFAADGDYTNMSVDAPSGIHAHAIIPYCFPYADIAGVEGVGLWEGLIMLDSCPFSVIRNINFRHVPNLGTWSGSGMEGRIGYGVSLTALSGGSVVYDVAGQHSRHVITTDGHGLSASSALTNGSNWLKCGEPCDVDVYDIRSFSAWGVPIDTHEEGININFDGVAVYYPVRGSLGGSYRPYGAQLRCSSASISNYRQYGGQYGVRIAGQSNRHAGSVYRLKNIYVEGLNSPTDVIGTGGTSDDSNRNAAVIVSPQENTYIAAQANIPTIFIDDLITHNCNQSLVVCGTNISGAAVNVRLGRANFVRGGVPLELFGNSNLIVTDRITFDFDGTTRTPAALACVALGAREGKVGATVTGAEVTFMVKPNVIKSHASKPASFFLEKDTVANKYYTLQDNSFTEANIGAVTATTLLNSGSTTIISR